MGIRDWFRGGGARAAADPDDLRHLREWASTRVGIEAYLEPETLVNIPSLVLVAFDGEWTRRDIGSSQAAIELARELDIPLFDVMETKYPQRMREFEEGRRAVERRERRERLREQVKDLEN